MLGSLFFPIGLGVPESSFGALAPQTVPGPTAAKPTAATPDAVTTPAAAAAPAVSVSPKGTGNVDASNQTSAAKVAPTQGYTAYAEELAHSNMIRTIDTCVVSSFDTCSTVQDAKVFQSDLLLPPKAHVLFFGSEALRQLVDVIVAVHRQEGELREHVVLDKSLLGKFDHAQCELLEDRKARGGMAANLMAPVAAHAKAQAKMLAADASPTSLLEVGSDDASDRVRTYHLDMSSVKDVNRVCNVISNNTMCDSHATGNYVRYVFSNGARLTAIINYRPLQSLADVGTLGRLRHALQYQGITNAFFMAPQSNAAFDDQCKHEVDKSYVPDLDPSASRYACVHEHNVSVRELHRHVECAQELPHFSALAGLNIPRVLLVPAMYNPGNLTHDRFKHFLGLTSRKYDCSAGHPVLEPGVGSANTTHHTEHECVVVCEEHSPDPGQRARCHAGSAMVMAAELVNKTRESLRKLPPRRLRRLRRSVALKAEAPSAAAKKKKQRLNKRARKVEAKARQEARRLRKLARETR